MGPAVLDEDLTVPMVDAAEQVAPAKASADIAAEALGRASRKATFRFEPPSLPIQLDIPDVAQRLIELELAGLADDLTWARYDR
jgi:hypothetical protein